ncbi:MAG: hypothetical protein U5K71_05835 [Gracilimonas sp.]|nr:hypothetical protein [Gracilimonas sp.]
MAAKITINHARFHLIYVGILILLSGCHAYVLDDAQADLRNSFTAGEYDNASELIKKFENDKVYRSKDAVLKNLEGGMIYHFAGKYDSSSTYLSNAEYLIEDAYTKSVSRGIGSFLTNDNTLTYDGEPYEDVYLNAFKSLNFMHQQDWESALVEARRMSYKMERLDIRLKGLAEAFAKTDSSGQEWSSGKVNVQNSAFSHFLSSVLFAKTGKFDDSRIEYEKFSSAIKEQNTFGTLPKSDPANLKHIQEPQAYNVLITAFSGQAPMKVQEDFRLWLDDGDDESFYVKFSLPALKMYNSRVHSIRIRTDSLSAPLYLVEEMDEVSAEIYQAKKPIIYTRSLLRATVKATGSSLISSSVKKKHKNWGFLLEVLGMIGQETTEKADLRGWQTMPGKAWVNAVKLPEGTHDLEIEYLSANNIVLYSETHIINISGPNDLLLLESIFSH